MSAFFEDIEVGDTLDLGEHTFTREDIVRFAENTIRRLFISARRPPRRPISVACALPVGTRQRYS